MAILKLEHIRKTYDKGEIVEPLRDINIEVNKKDFVVIQGPSGMGKSTLLYVMGTLLGSSEGKLEINGVDINTLSDEDITTLRAEKIGFLFQDSNLIQALTLKENLEFAEKLGMPVKGQSRADEYLNLLGLADRADYLPYKLSGGQRRRAMVARALIKSPELILADEPTNDLDDQWAEKIVSILKDRCSKGAAVVMVTHNEKWTKDATKKYCLNNGILEEI